MRQGSGSDRVTDGGGHDDVHALTALSTEYAVAADTRDGERFASLFTDDGELVVPKVPTDLRPVVTRRGRAELLVVPDGLRRYDRTYHQVTNHTFTVVGDRAEGEVVCTAHHVSRAPDTDGPRVPGDSGATTDAPEGTDLVWFIRYHDTYRRTDHGWRFERRVLDLQWTEEHPVVRMGAPPSADRATP